MISETNRPLAVFFSIGGEIFLPIWGIGSDPDPSVYFPLLTRPLILMIHDKRFFYLSLFFVVVLCYIWYFMTTDWVNGYCFVFLVSQHRRRWYPPEALFVDCPRKLSPSSRFVGLFGSLKSYGWSSSSAPKLHQLYSHMTTGWWFGTFFIFPFIENYHPNWLSYFAEG